MFLIRDFLPLNISSCQTKGRKQKRREAEKSKYWQIISCARHAWMYLRMFPLANCLTLAVAFKGGFLATEENSAFKGHFPGILFSEVVLLESVSRVMQSFLTGWALETDRNGNISITNPNSLSWKCLLRGWFKTREPYRKDVQNNLKSTAIKYQVKIWCWFRIKKNILRIFLI